MKENLKERAILKSVKVNFTDLEDAEEFKKDVEEMFDIPKPESKYRVTHGITKNGGMVYIENKKIYRRQFVERKN